MLGTLGAVGGAYRADDLTVTPAGDTVAALTAGLDRITMAARARGLSWTVAPERATSAQQAPASQHPDGYLETRSDGTFTEVADGVARPFEVPRTQAAESAGTCPVIISTGRKEGNPAGRSRGRDSRHSPGRQQPADAIGVRDDMRDGCDAGEPSVCRHERLSSCRVGRCGQDRVERAEARPFLEKA